MRNFLFKKLINTLSQKAMLSLLHALRSLRKILIDSCIYDAIVKENQA